MSDTLINITGKLDQPTIELFIAVNEVMVNADAGYLVVGASARDLVLHFGYGTRIDRATSDIDFGINVESWQQFEHVRTQLMRKGFRDHSGQPQRLYSPFDLQIDIVPFGKIEDDCASIAWPPAGDVLMSVLGFQEALEHSDRVRISESPTIDIPVATPAGMALLKLIAWTDRESGLRRKDALDLAYLFETYERIPAITDRIYEGSELQSYEYDTTLAGAHIMGLHAADIATPETKEFVRRLIEGRLPGCSKQKLAEEMCSSLGSQLERNEGLLDAFCSGYLH